MPVPWPRFHLAVPVHDLAVAESFYGGVLGFPKGRQTDISVDWNAHGHQVVTHLVEGQSAESRNVVDGKNVPVPHFGLILDVEAFHELADRLKQAGTEFVVAPYLFILAARENPDVPNAGVAADLIGPLLYSSYIAGLVVGAGLLCALIFLRRRGGESSGVINMHSSIE